MNAGGEQSPGNFAGIASMGWIADRLFYVHNPVNFVVDSAVHHGVWIAAVLFLISLLCWRLPMNARTERI